MRLYKLTDEHDRSGTTNKDATPTQWGEGVTHTAPGTGDLCGSGWIHAYTDPLLAVLLNPVHSDFKRPHLWEAKGEVGKTDHGLKVGCTTLTTLCRIELPVITTEQLVTICIRCALVVYHEPSFITWANAWLDGTDRSVSAAEAAAAAAAAEAAAVVRAAAEAAMRAMWAGDILDLIAIAHAVLEG